MRIFKKKIEKKQKIYINCKKNEMKKNKILVGQYSNYVRKKKITKQICI